MWVRVNYVLLGAAKFASRSEGSNPDRSICPKVFADRREIGKCNAAITYGATYNDE